MKHTAYRQKQICSDDETGTCTVQRTLSKSFHAFCGEKTIEFCSQMGGVTKQRNKNTINAEMKSETLHQAIRWASRS